MRREGLEEVCRGREGYGERDMEGGVQREGLEGGRGAEARVGRREECAEKCAEGGRGTERDMKGRGVEGRVGGRGVEREVLRAGCGGRGCGERGVERGVWREGCGGRDVEGGRGSEE